MKNPGFVQKVLMYRALHNQILMSCADGSIWMTFSSTLLFFSISSWWRCFGGNNNINNNWISQTQIMFLCPCWYAYFWTFFLSPFWKKKGTECSFSLNLTGALDWIRWASPFYVHHKYRWVATGTIFTLCKFMDVGRAKRFGGICTFPSGGIVCVLLQIFIIFSLFFWTVFCLERWLVVELVPDFQEAVPRASAHCHAVLGDTKAADTVVVTCQDACSLRSYAVPYVAVEIVVAGEE